MTDDSPYCRVKSIPEGCVILHVDGEEIRLMYEELTVTNTTEIYRDTGGAILGRAYRTVVSVAIADAMPYLELILVLKKSETAINVSFVDASLIPQTIVVRAKSHSRSSRESNTIISFERRYPMRPGTTVGKLGMESSDLQAFWGDPMKEIQQLGQEMDGEDDGR